MKLRAHLDELGGTVALEVSRTRFPPLRRVLLPECRADSLDTRLELDERITAATVAWAVGAFTGDPASCGVKRFPVFVDAGDSHVAAIVTVPSAIPRES